MTKKDILVTVDPAALNYEHPIYMRLDEDKNNPQILEEQVKYYKRLGVPVSYFSLNGQKSKHYYAVFEGNSEERADALNKLNNSDVRKRDRAYAAIREHETESYNVMVDSGYDAPSYDDDPAEIEAFNTVIKALVKEYNDLSDEKKRICDMIMDNVPQRKAAEKLGMARRTYRDQMEAVLKELGRKLRPYR